MATKVMDCDLVVLGAGGCGLVAAVKAADVSGKKVIVLEKAKKPGGASIFAHAVSVMDTKWQKEAGYAVSEPQDISGQFFDWLVEKGGAEKCFRMAKEGERKMGGAGSIFMPVRLDRYKDHPDPSIGPGWWGSYIVEKMIECCEKTGIPVLTETSAKKFITDDKGKVTGVLAGTRDGQLLVNCKACVIAAGGFGANYEKLQKYWPEEFNNKQIFNLCPPTITGDCIDMAEEIGAAIDQTKWGMSSFPGGFYSSTPIHHPYSYTIMGMMGNAMTVSVNLNGERWMNEGGGGMMSGTVSVASQPKGVAYSIIDSEILDAIGPTLVNNVMDEPDVAVMKKYREDIAYEVAIDEEGASGDHAKKADTLAELALKMKIDPKTFVATIERYNKFCDNGKDLDFGKAAGNLKPIRKPPFYAFFGHRFRQCTKGLNGIAVNPKFEVLNTKGEVMPGLWAGGDGCTIFGGVKRSMRGMPGGAAPGGAPGAGASSGATGGAAAGTPSGAPGAAAGAPGAVPGASAAGANVLSTEGSPNGGLSAAVLSGYQAGINAANYLKNI